MAWVQPGWWAVGWSTRIHLVTRKGAPRVNVRKLGHDPPESINRSRVLFLGEVGQPLAKLKVQRCL
jgi:hypothetical protein